MMLCPCIKFNPVESDTLSANRNSGEIWTHQLIEQVSTHTNITGSIIASIESLEHVDSVWGGRPDQLLYKNI